MISLLVPTRGRPKNMKRVWNTAKATAYKPSEIEIIFYMDKDDKKSHDTFNKMKCEQVKGIIGERIILSQMWNECYKIAEGVYYQHCGDDIVFSSKNWDRIVMDEFDKFPDRIAFVYGRDREVNQATPNFGTHGFLHKNWIDVVGYFVPPYFSSCMNDKWLTEVAIELKRNIYNPNIYTEHMHYALGKGTKDQTHKDRLARRQKDGVKKIYRDKLNERKENVRKLKEFIDGYS